MIRGRALVLSAVLALQLCAVMARAASPPPGPKPITGCVNQTITDGFWNLKVASATLGTLPTDSEVVAWGVTFAFGPSGSKVLTPADSGFGNNQPELILKDGTKLDMTTSSDIAFSHAFLAGSLKPHTSTTLTLWYPTTDVTSKAVTFSFPLNAVNPVLQTSYGYPVKNPSFSVDLTCNKAAK